MSRRSPPDADRPASTLGVPLPASGRATRANSRAIASAPRRSRACEIAALLASRRGSSPRSAHANPSEINASTSSYEPSECSAIPIAKYAIDLAGNDRRRFSVRPHSAITASTTCAGNTLISRPTDTRSGNRRSDSGFLHPERGIPPNYTRVTLIERYCRNPRRSSKSVVGPLRRARSPMGASASVRNMRCGRPRSVYSQAYAKDAGVPS